MKPIFFALPGNESLTDGLVKKLNGEKAIAVIRQFPDGETYVKIETEVSERIVFLVCTLNQPDLKLIPLFFLSRTAKTMGAKKVILIAPYLAYMRQDQQFEPGEGLTSAYFGSLISQMADALITMDPHLHRRSSLEEIYSIPTITLHASDLIANWIQNQVKKPVLVGPDSESEQWVASVARVIGSPYVILQKKRLGDRAVSLSLPDMAPYLDFTPVVLDDIISTARTMQESIIKLKQAGMNNPVCIGIHGIFTGTAFEDLVAAGTDDIVTTNSISHPSNKIDIVELISTGLNSVLDKFG
jgi:ribose-phosphate pyrophosphokinase